MRSREASARCCKRNEGGLPTKCQAQESNKNRRKARSQKANAGSGKEWDEDDLFRLCSCSLQGLGLYLLEEEKERRREEEMGGEEGGIYRRGDGMPEASRDGERRGMIAPRDAPDMQKSVYV